jgi:DNA-directed RNA polymerase subunit beta'
VNGEFTRDALETTVGRVLLMEVVPKEVDFNLVNQVMTKKDLGCAGRCLLPGLRSKGDRVARRPGADHRVQQRDRGRHLDLHRRHEDPGKKQTIIGQAQAEVAEIEEQYVEGLITDGERYNKVIDIWARVGETVSKALMEGISTETVKSPDGKHNRRCRPSTRSS